MPIDLLIALTGSPYPERVTAAAALIVDGRYGEAVALLEETIAALDASKADPKLITPFLQLCAEGLRNAAARFASSHPYPSRVDQRMRIDWLEQAYAVYRRLDDVPNQVMALKALAAINMSIGEGLSAMYQLRELGNLALPRHMLDVQQLRQLFTQLADAHDVAYAQAVDHRQGIHYNLAIEGAAYRYLSGDPAQAIGNLNELHLRYLNAAKNLHQMGNHERATRLLVSGIYWGLATGHSEVLEHHADLLVNYMAQHGDAQAIAVYDRAITLRRGGAQAVADGIILKQAMSIMAHFLGTSHLKTFHEIVDQLTVQQIEAFDRTLKDLSPLDARIPELAMAKRRAAMLQLTSWAQTLSGLLPTFQSARNPMLDGLISHGFTTSLQEAHPAFGKADLMLREYYDATGNGRTSKSSLSAAGVQAIYHIRWNDPANVQEVCTVLAHALDLTSTEVELALMPNGIGSSAERRIRQVLGELEWERLRRAAIVRGLLDQHRVWRDVELEMRRR